MNQNQSRSDVTVGQLSDAPVHTKNLVRLREQGDNWLGLSDSRFGSWLSMTRRRLAVVFDDMRHKVLRWGASRKRDVDTSSRQSPQYWELKGELLSIHRGRASRFPNVAPPSRYIYLIEKNQLRDSQHEALATFITEEVDTADVLSHFQTVEERYFKPHGVEPTAKMTDKPLLDILQERSLEILRGGGIVPEELLDEVLLSK